MEIMDLVRRDRRSLEYRQSCVSKNSLMRLACRPGLASHLTVVGSRCAQGKTVACIICAHPMKATPARQLSLEVIDA